MKKKTIKIGFKYFWRNFEPNEFYLTELLKKKYNVVITDKPDYMFFSVFKDNNKFTYQLNSFFEKLLPKKIHNGIKNIIFKLRRKRGVLIKGNFIKIFYSYENCKIDMSKCDWAFSYPYEDEIKDLRYMRLPILSIKENNFLKKQKNINKIKKQKTKFCNFIYNNDVKFRNEFFKRLSKYKRVDSYGKCMNNTSFSGKKDDWKDLRFSKNKYYEKLKTLNNYKFTIAFENSSVSGYTTEKLIHPMLVGSIPIYWGNPRVREDFNTKSFINCHDFKNIDEVIKRVIEIDQNDEIYEKMLKESWVTKNQAKKIFDEEKILNRLIEIIENGKK